MASGQVVKNTAYLVSAFVGQKLLSFVYFMIIARIVGEDAIGRYAIAVTLTTLFSIFVDMGLANVLVREVAKFPEKAETLLGNVLGVKAFLAVLTVIAVHIATRVLQYSPEIALMVSIASVVMVLDSVHLVLYATMRGFQRLHFEAIGVVTGQAVTIVSGIIFLLLDFPLPYLVVALFLGSSWNVVWSLYAMRRFFSLRPTLRITPGIIRFLWSVTIPFALAGIFSRVYSYVDTIMLSKMVSESQVGLYSVAYKIAFAFQFLPMAFAAAIYPAMSALHVQNKEKLSMLFRVATTYLAIVAVPLAVGIGTLAPEFLRLAVGPAYEGSANVLRILLASLVFGFLYWPAGSLLNACDRQTKNTVVMGVTMVVNVIANSILIPILGIVGAAFAALIGNMVLWLLALIFSRGLVFLSFRSSILITAKILCSAALMGMIAIGLRGMIHPILIIPIAVITYMGAMLALGGVRIVDVKTLFSLFTGKGKGVSDIVP